MRGHNDKWEFYQDKKGEFRWRRIAPNGNIVGASQHGYSSKEMSEAYAERHGYKGNPNNLGAGDKWEIYQNKRGEYRWRRTAANGEITGSSAEGYKYRDDCVENAKRNGLKGSYAKQA